MAADVSADEPIVGSIVRAGESARARDSAQPRGIITILPMLVRRERARVTQSCAARKNAHTIISAGCHAFASRLVILLTAVLFMLTLPQQAST